MNLAPRTRALSLAPALICLSQLAFAPVGFAQNFQADELLDTSPQRSTFSLPTRVHWADLDGDRDLDPLFVQQNGSTFGSTAWAENLGGGRLGPTRLFGPSTGAGAVNGAPIGVDLDRDGDIDVLVSYVPGSQGSSFRWVENLGGGEFAPVASLTPPDGVAVRQGALALDLDGDGDLDLVVQSTPVLWYENLGGLNFAPSTTIVASPQSLGSFTDIGSGDVNGNGLIELYAAHSADGVYRVEGDGQGGLLAPVLVVPPTTGEFSTNVVTGDVDGDGDVDLVTETRSIGAPFVHTIVLHVNAGGGVLTPRPWGTGILAHEGLQLADLNSDGLLDVVRLDLATHQVSFMLQQAGSSILGASIDVPGSLGSSAAGAVNFNNDGHADLWVAGSRFLLARGDGSGTFDVFTDPGPHSLGSSAPAVGDVNGDGSLDFAVIDGVEVRVLAGLPDGSYTFQPGPTLPVSTRGAPALADVDGDGDLDMIVGTGVYPDFYAGADLLLNVGGSFTTATNLVNEPWSDADADALLGDADGDGDVDIFWTYDGLGPIRRRGGWLIGDGAGGFSPPAVVDLDPFFETLPPVDVDGDGGDDILQIGTSATERPIRFRKTLPGGQLSPSVTLLTLTAPFSASVPICVEDVNGDGFVDVLASSLTWGETRVFPGLPGLTFGPPITVFPQALDATHVAVLDADGDGRMDILTMGADGGYLALGLGGSSFATPTSVPAGTTPILTLGVADADGDSDDDLVLWSDAGVAIRRNNSHLGISFCSATPNSTGAVASLFATGSSSVSANALQLHAQDLPPNQFGLFVLSEATGFLPGVGGTPGVLCLDPTRTIRLIGPGLILMSSATGTVELNLNLAHFPLGQTSGPIPAGATRYFQYWTRDGAAGTANLSGGLGIGFKR